MQVCGNKDVVKFRAMVQPYLSLFVTEIGSDVHPLINIMAPCMQELNNTSGFLVTTPKLY